VDTGFSGVVGCALHVIPPGFLPECPMTTPKYSQKISYSSKPQISLSASFIFFWCGSNLIYKDECLFVCMELIQIHISELISTELCTRLPLRLEEVVGYVWTHNISTFPPFRCILSGASADLCAEDGCWRQSPPLLRYIPCWCDVTDMTCTVRNALKMRRSERNTCVWKWKPDEMVRK